MSDMDQLVFLDFAKSTSVEDTKSETASSQQKALAAAAASPAPAMTDTPASVRQQTGIRLELLPDAPPRPASTHLKIGDEICKGVRHAHRTSRTGDKLASLDSALPAMELLGLVLADLRHRLRLNIETLAVLMGARTALDVALFVVSPVDFAADMLDQHAYGPKPGFEMRMQVRRWTKEMENVEDCIAIAKREVRELRCRVERVEALVVDDDQDMIPDIEGRGNKGKGKDIETNESNDEDVKGLTLDEVHSAVEETVEWLEQVRRAEVVLQQERAAAAREEDEKRRCYFAEFMKRWAELEDCDKE